MSEEPKKPGVKHNWQQVYTETEEPGEFVDEGNVTIIPDDRMEDPREQTEWFTRLPDHAKDEFRELWRIQDGEGKHQRMRRKHTTHHYVLEMGGIVAVFALVLESPTFLGFLLAFVFGAVAGYLAALVRAANNLYAFFLVTGWLLWGACFGQLDIAFRLMSLLIVTGIGKALGMTRRMQKFDGSQL